MEVASSKIYQITEPRDGYLYSTYFQIPDGDSTSSSEDASSDESRWVIFPLASYYEANKIFGKQKEQKKHRKSSKNRGFSENSSIPQSFCLPMNDKEDQYSLIPPTRSLPACITCENGGRASSFREKLKNIKQYGLITQQSKPLTFSLPHKFENTGSDGESMPYIFPIQRKTRSTHSTGSFSGSKPRKLVRGISLEREHSVMKTKNLSGSMRSCSVDASQSRMGHIEQSAACDAKLQEMEIEGPSSETDSNRSSNHIKKQKSCYGFTILKGYYNKPSST